MSTPMSTSPIIGSSETLKSSTGDNPKASKVSASTEDSLERLRRASRCFAGGMFDLTCRKQIQVTITMNRLRYLTRDVAHVGRSSKLYQCVTADQRGSRAARAAR